jgi:NADPH:quinone reductase-like Zn-dependent oxidoreductase
MKAAVLHTFGQSPRYEDFADPQATEGEVLVRVKAASLKNVDKMMASGSHYDRFPDLPCVCGVDGVGLLDDGGSGVLRRSPTAVRDDGRAHRCLPSLVSASS